METLMTLIEQGVEEKEQTISISSITTQNELEELGFKKISNNILSKIEVKKKINNIAKYKYLKITDLMIHTYLANKVKEYNKIHEKLKTSSILYGNIQGNELGDISYTYRFSPDPWAILHMSPDNKNNKITEIVKQTCDYYSGEKMTIGKFVWKECPIEEYESVPPKEVLTKLRMHKDRLLFDYFTIASVENIKDPLLFGRITETEDRYFIAQWGG
mgnify:FL=1